MQNGIDDFNLPSCVGHRRARVAAHERRAKDDGQVMRVHAVNVRVVHHAVQVQRDGAQRRVVGVGEAVDDGVQRVAADDVVVVFCRQGRLATRFSMMTRICIQGQKRTGCVDEAAVVLRR